MSMADTNPSSTASCHNSSGGRTGPEPPHSPCTPIHSAPNLPSTSLSLPSSHFHKKSRKKRKELDALVPEEKIRRKNSFSSVGAGSSLAGDSDDTEGGRLGLLAGGGKSSSSHGGAAGVWGVVPGVLVIVVMVGTAVMAMAALRLLMVTRRDMELLTRRLGSVEARSSELPARFHEAHVRLQLLQRNTSALWDAWQALHTNLTRQQAQVVGLQEQVASLQSSVQAAPQLSSLPQDVKALQSSVAAFGSTLQDLQTGLRAVTAEHKTTDQKIKDLQGTFNALSNSTRVVPSYNKDPSLSIGDVVTSLVQEIAQLNTSMTVLHDNITSMGQKEDLQNFDVKAHQLQMDARLTNLSRELLHPASSDVTNSVVALTNNLSALVTSVRQDVNNLSLEVMALDTTSSEHSSRLRQLLQNVSVVKGVEKKLEGSQLQLASGVSDVKQQLQSLQHIVSTLTSTTTSTTTLIPSERGVASTAQASSGSARKRRAVVGNDQQVSHRRLSVDYRPVNGNTGDSRNGRLEQNKELRPELAEMEDYSSPYELLNFDNDEQLDSENYNTPLVHLSSIINDLGVGEDRSTRTDAEDEKEPFMEQRLMITESPRGL